MVADGVMRHTGTARLHREFLTAAFHSAQEVASPVFKIETRLISATVRPSPAVICLPACARLRGRVPLRLSINYEYSYHAVACARGTVDRQLHAGPDATLSRYG